MKDEEDHYQPNETRLDLACCPEGLLSSIPDHRYGLLEDLLTLLFIFYFILALPFDLLNLCQCFLFTTFVTTFLCLDIFIRIEG